MRIAQIVLPDASAYERKSQRIDQRALSDRHEVLVTSLEALGNEKADLAHVYTSGELPPAAFRAFPIRYVASTDLPTSRWSLRKPKPPSLVFSPLIEKGEEGRIRALPEAVDEEYWSAIPWTETEREVRIIGSYVREPLRNIVEQTFSRLQRFRSDLAWRLISHPPTPSDLAGVDVWVDPAVDENDFDGFVAEALVVGVPVVASRTPINERRLEKGRCGGLMPTGDPNELAHAILTTLFKQEVRESRTIAARQTISRFQARQRLRILLRAYETLVT